MKRLISLACAALFAMFAGIEFVLPKADEFIFNPKKEEVAYFQAPSDTTGSAVDYKSLYGQVYGFDFAGAEVCDIVARQDSREVWVELADAGWSDQKGIYAPVPEGSYSTPEKLSSVALRYTITSTEDVNISAPAAGTINTSHYACEYGAFMEFVIERGSGSVTYTVTIENAKCWYCCANKTYPDNGKYTATSKDTLKGKSMAVGDVLCVGKTGTTITITRTEKS